MNQLNEVRRFQKIAGLLKEGEANQIVDKVEDSVEAKLDKLSLQQIQQLQADLTKMGITADTSVEDAAEKIEGSLDEAEGDDKKKLADTLQSIGTGLIGSLLVPIIPLAIGHSTGLGVASGFGITLAAGGLLVGLAKALQHKGNSKMEDWHPDDPASVDVDDIEDKDPDDYDDVSEDTDTRGRTSYDLVKGPNEDPLVKRILVNLHNKYGKEGYHYDPYMKRLTVYGEASEDEAIVDMLSALFDQPEYQDLSEDDYSENPAPNDDESQSGDTAVDNINEVRRLQKIAFKK